MANQHLKRNTFLKKVFEKLRASCNGLGGCADLFGISVKNGYRKAKLYFAFLRL